MVDIPMGYPVSAPMPVIDIPKEMAHNFENRKVGDKVKVTISYEVVEKDESGVWVAINNIFSSKRKM